LTPFRIQDYREQATVGELDDAMPAAMPAQGAFSSAARLFDGRAAGPVELAAAQDVIRDETDSVPAQRAFVVVDVA
jgi:hypothetical protein